MNRENPRISWQHAAMPSFEFTRDVFSRDGFTLLVDGQSQSHVDPADPARLFFEYTRRIGNIVDAFRTPGAPIRALHLGGGALSLPRYVEATRPDSTQVVVEHDGALLDAVLDRVPLPADTGIELAVADAADVVADLAHAADLELAVADAADLPHVAADPARFDLIVVDLYTGLQPPDFVSSRRFVERVLAVLAPGGLAVVNVADAAGLARLGAQARAYARSAPAAELLVAGPSAVLAGADEGNAILVVAPDGLPHDLAGRLAETGPHPADVLTHDRLDFVLWGAC